MNGTQGNRPVVTLQAFNVGTHPHRFTQRIGPTLASMEQNQYSLLSGFEVSGGCNAQPRHTSCSERVDFTRWVRKRLRLDLKSVTERWHTQRCRPIRTRGLEFTSSLGAPLYLGEGWETSNDAHNVGTTPAHLRY